jgi:AraC-like DNA-binding protein
MDTPCLTARFVAPFAQVLSTYESYDAHSLRRLKAIDPESRIPTQVANWLLVDQVAQTRDPDLGLKAAREMPLGVAGALDYAMHSAATVRRAIEVGARYARLFNDTLTIHLEVDGDRAIVRMRCEVPQPRAAYDFGMSAWYANHLRAFLRDDAGLECWFEHGKPSNTSEYDRTFDRAALRFGAPSYGFTFDRTRLDAPLATANSATHVVLCGHVALAMAQLATQHSLTARVREHALQELLEGEPSAPRVARRLRMSARTLGRHLEREGTTFTALLDDVRHELALRYVGAHGLGFADIGARLGFAHVEAFYRAFKRWTGQTPLAYRRARGPAPRSGAARRE